MFITVSAPALTLTNQRYSQAEKMSGLEAILSQSAPAVGLIFGIPPL